MGNSVDYVNRALQTLGARKISVLSYEDSQNAATATDLYEPCVNELLGDGTPWGFARVRVQLSQLVPAPANTDWTYAYALPANTLNAIRTDVDNGSWIFYADPDSGNRVLYSNETAVYADIIRRTDDSLFPPHFVKALVARLTAALAMPVTRSAAAMQAFEKLANDAAATAAVIDWNMAPWPQLDDGNVLTDAKFG